MSKWTPFGEYDPNNDKNNSSVENNVNQAWNPFQSMDEIVFDPFAAESASTPSTSRSNDLFTSTPSPSPSTSKEHTTIFAPTALLVGANALSSSSDNNNNNNNTSSNRSRALATTSSKHSNDKSSKPPTKPLERMAKICSPCYCVLM